MLKTIFSNKLKIFIISFLLHSFVSIESIPVKAKTTSDDLFYPMEEFNDTSSRTRRESNVTFKRIFPSRIAAERTCKNSKVEEITRPIFCLNLTDISKNWDTYCAETLYQCLI
ncbi:uncharacterized protein LOC122502275 [Leptopilina heterotoma]|uniref:uncharacterized protein LOC122502275 n=1 Tax=Leptopilina heterotoma TaxID=63436 RepID=UPI001CA979E8|nr:uncharacterized protein LOC122502275 [Leptopilina heterotoma]